MIYDNKTYWFYDKKTIIRSILKMFINSNKKKNIIYIHNLDYDGFLILEEVSLYNKLKIDFLIDKMKIYYLKIIFSNMSIEFRCSKKILPASLNDIARDFKLKPKLKYPYSFIDKNRLYYCGKLECDGNIWDYINIKEYTIEYCIRDVEITRNFIIELAKIIWSDQKIKIIDSYTISALSLKIFEKKFNYMKVPLIFPRSLDLFIREAYFGGRVEIFGNTDKNVYHYDFPGMYGLCMYEKMPISIPYWESVKNVDLHNLKPGYYTIRWRSDSLRIPVLPVKNIYGKLIFPNGEHSGTYWFEEIEAFLINGGKVISIDRALIYDKYDYAFNTFVDYFNIFRSRGGVFKIMGKLIINSLYGKLGSGIHNARYIVCYNSNELTELFNKYNILSITELNKIFIVEVHDNTIINGLNIGIAAAITSKARIKLLNTMIDVEKNGGRMLYCDTDSLFIEFEKEIYTGISKWDKNDSIYDAAVFALPKTYALKKNDKSIIKIKGITKPVIDFNEFKNKFINNEFLVFNEMYQVKKSNFKIEKGNIEKKINLFSYDKRIFDEHKKNTHI